MVKLSLLAIAALIALALIPGAAASSTCTISATVCKGQAYVDTSTGGVAGAIRCFFFDTDGTLGNHVCSSTQDRATWELNGGACLNLFYFDVTQGAVPPAAPNKVTLSVQVDNGATVVIAFQTAGAEPANGASFSFCATSTGAAGGSARMGTYRIYLQAIKDNAPGGVGNFNVDSDGTAAVGTIVQSAKGALRGNTLVSSLTASAPPSGAFFAYGPAGDESVTLTATRTQQNDVGTISFDTRHASGGSILETSSTATSAAAATDTAAFVADNTYDAAKTTYDGEFNVVANAALTGLPFTTFPATGHGAGVSQITTTKVRATALFTVDPRIVTDKDGSHTFATADDLATVKLTSSTGPATALFNRGETRYIETFILNARSQKLSRAMTFQTEDAATTTCNSIGSLTPTANLYSTTGTVGTSGCLAAFDTTGSLRKLRVTNTDQNHLGATIFFVSSFLWTDAHTQKKAPLVKDDWPMPNQFEDTTFIISADVTNLWCHLEGVRLDGTHIQTATNALVLKITETDDTTVLGTQTTQTTATGWDDQGTVGTSLAVAPAAPSRIVHAHCDATFNGNTGADSQSVSWISAYTADKACPIVITPTPSPGVTSRVWIHNEKLQTPMAPDQVPLLVVSKITGSAWVAAGGLVGTVKNSVDNTNTVNGALYYQDWTPPTKADVNLLAVCYIEGVSIQQSQAVIVAPPTGGDPLKVFAGPIDGLPNENVLLTISESFTDGTARTGNAAGTLVYVYNPSNALVVNGATPTEVAFGTYRYSYSLGATPTDGPYLVLVKTLDPTTAATIGTSNTFVVHNMNPNTVLPNSIDLGGSAIPPILSATIYTLAIAAIYVGAIVCLQFRDVGAKLFAGLVAALGAFLGFNTGAPLVARAAFIAVGFLIMAYAWFLFGLQLMRERQAKQTDASGLEDI